MNHYYFSESLSNLQSWWKRLKQSWLGEDGTLGAKQPPSHVQPCPRENDTCTHTRTYLQRPVHQVSDHQQDHSVLGGSKQ